MASHQAVQRRMVAMARLGQQQQQQQQGRQAGRPKHNSSAPITSRLLRADLKLGRRMQQQQTAARQQA
jgi:hypothetical protein